ncbi:MAG: porin [Flavobacteriaceae bacterium]|nr:porin [Flavobacteriaceae bacterium]
MRKNFIVNRNVLSSFFLSLGCLCSLMAQEETEKPWKFSGSIDTYFRQNLNGLNKDIPLITDSQITGYVPPSAPASSFANDAGFALGMVNVVGSYEGKKFGAVADLVFGPRGEDAVFGSPVGSTNIINQLYVYWQATDKLKLTLGNFNTFLGYEVISPVDNFHYSTSYLFSYGPFSHSGIKADIDLGGGVSAMLAIMSATDFTDRNPFGKYSLGAQLGYKDQYLNILYGEQGFDRAIVNGTAQDIDIDPLFQIDYTGGIQFSDSFFTGINASYQATDDVGFYGVALYPEYSISENTALGIRAEFFKELEDGGPVYGADTETWALTFTADMHFGPLTIKPELRYDKASISPFLDSDLEPQDNLASFVLAAIFHL